MILVDTNILVFIVLEGPQSPAARELLSKDGEWRSEHYALIELANVLVTTMRVRGLALSVAEAAHATVRALIEPGLVTVGHADVMRLARLRRISAYDARFLVAAQELGVRLTTEDAKLRRAAPELTQSLDEALADA